MNYLDESTEKNYRHKAKLKLMWGGILVGMTILGLIGGLAGDAKHQSNLVSYIVLMVPGLSLLILGMQQKKELGIACKLAAYLSAISGSSISLTQISQAIAVKESALAKMLDRLIQKQLLRQVTLDQGCGMLLFRGQSWEIHSYVCPYCGADVTAEAGKLPRCPYCGRSFEIPES